jgi:hypothetical protein
MRKQYDNQAERIDDTGYRVYCVECDNWFESVRSDAAFCSSTCRSRAHRRDKRRQRDIDIMLAAVVKVCDNLPKTGDSPEFDALNKAIKFVSVALNRVRS